MQLRDLTAPDLPALLALCRRSLPDEPWSAELLRRRCFGDPTVAPGYRLGAWDGTRLAGVALGVTRITAEGPVGGLQLIAVDPWDQRQGLATRLLDQLEARMLDDGLGRLRVGRCPPNYFWPGVDPRATAAVCLLLRRGYQRSGDACNMLVDLTANRWDTSDDEARLAAQGWAIRRLQPEDRTELGSWLATTWGPTWQYEGLDALSNHPESGFVAVAAGQIRGFACYNVSGFERLFGPTGVDEACRGLGIGRVLLYRCLGDMALLGQTHAEIGWVGPIAFYASAAGATINRVFWYLEKPLAH